MILVKKFSMVLATICVLQIVLASEPACADDLPNWDAGSPIASALVFYDKRQQHLDTAKIASIINAAMPDKPAKAENAHAFTMRIPLVRVKAPVPFVVTIEDTADAATEVRETADRAEQAHELGSKELQQLRKCNAYLSISSAHSSAKITDKAITITDTTDLDPTTPKVLNVIKTLSHATKGQAIDNVHGGWLVQKAN